MKEIIADQIKIAMTQEGLTKTAMAARRQTNYRLLSAGNPLVTLTTLQRAASAEGICGWSGSDI